MLVNDPAKTRRETVIAGIVLAVLQLALVPNVGIGNGRANLALVFVAYVCLGGSAAKAPLIGFFAGLFYDLVGSGPIGLMALLLTVAAWVMASAGQSRVADDFVSALTFYVPVAGVVALIYAVVLMATGQVSSLVDAVIFRALPGFILDVISFAIFGAIISRTQAPSSRLGGMGGRGSKGGFTMKRGL